MAKKIEAYETTNGKLVATLEEATKIDNAIANKAAINDSVATLRGNLGNLLLLAETYNLESANKTVIDINNWLVDTLTKVNKLI